MVTRIPHSIAKQFFYIPDLGSSSSLQIVKDCVFERMKLRYGTQPTTTSVLKRFDLTIRVSDKSFRIRATDPTTGLLTGGITIDGVNGGSVLLPNLSTLLLEQKIAFNTSISPEKRKEAIDELLKRLSVSSRTEADAQEFLGLLESCGRKGLPIEMATTQKEIAKLAVQQKMPQAVLTKNVMSFLKGTGRRRKRISHKTRRRKHRQNGV